MLASMFPWMFLLRSIFQRAGRHVAGNARSKSRKAAYVGDLFLSLLIEMLEIRVCTASEVFVSSLKPNWLLEMPCGWLCA